MISPVRSAIGATSDVIVMRSILHIGTLSIKNCTTSKNKFLKSLLGKISDMKFIIMLLRKPN